MAAAVFQGKPQLFFDGNEVTSSLQGLIDRIVVDDHLHLPDSASISFRDPSKDSFEKAGAVIGAKLKIKVTATGRGEASSEDFFEGEVTGLEADYDSLGSRVVVRAYDLSHRMHRGRHTEAYKNKTDSDIAKRLAERCGLPLGEIENSRRVHEHVSQVNLTDWEFIKARAREIGFEVGVGDGKFFFRKPKVNDGPDPGGPSGTLPLQLAFGVDLLEFRPRVSAVGQVEEVVARSWSYLDKKSVIGRKKTSDNSDAPEIPTKPDCAKKFKTKPHTISDSVFSTQDEADQAATGMAKQITAALGEADGVARGNPKISAGSSVAIAEVAKDFIGKWTVTSSRHIFDSTSYRTQFSVAGRQERSILGLASMGGTSGSRSASGPPVYGAVIGIVSDIKDPQGMHRARLTFPWLSDDYETDWVRYALPGAGNDRGFAWPSEVGDEVLVMFEHGDVRRPYVIGALYNGKDVLQGGKNIYDGSGRGVLRGLRSRTGHRLIFQDGFEGHEALVVTTGNDGYKIKLSQSDRTIEVKSDGSVSISGSGDVTIKAGQSMTLEAQMNLNLKAKNVSIKGDVKVAIDGAMVTLN
jgi:phage protein D